MKMMLRTVDHDFRDRLVVEELLDRSVADDVVADVLRELFEQLAVERRAVLRERDDDRLVQALLELLLVDGVVVEQRAELADDLAVHLEMHVGGQTIPLRGRRRRGRRSQRRRRRVVLDDLIERRPAGPRAPRTRRGSSVEGGSMLSAGAAPPDPIRVRLPSGRTPAMPSLRSVMDSL